MKSTVTRLTATAVIAAMLCGCGNLAEFSIFDTRVTSAGADQLLSDKFDKVDLPSLLDPDGRAKAKYDKTRANDAPSWSDLKEAERIDLSFAAFYNYPDTGANTLERRRDSVQETLLAASNRRCNIYKNYIQRLSSHTNMLFGGAATIAGAAGAIVAGATAARALAGTAGLFSGLRSEFNENFFQSIAIHVIVNGIDTRRQQVYRDIQLFGQAKSYSDYTVEAAVKDALYYHGQCSVMAGLEEAGAAIRTVNDPGLDALNRAIQKAQIARQLLEGKPVDLTKPLPGTAYTVRELLGGSYLTDTAAVLPIDAQTQTIADLNGALQSITDKVKDPATGIQDKDQNAIENAATMQFKTAVDMVTKCLSTATSQSVVVLNARAAVATSKPEDLAAKQTALYATESEARSVTISIQAVDKVAKSQTAAVLGALAGSDKATAVKSANDALASFGTTLDGLAKNDSCYKKG